MKRSIILWIFNYSKPAHSFIDEQLDSRSGSEEEFAQLENEVVKQHNRLAESKRKVRREKVADYKLNSTGPFQPLWRS